MYEDVMHENLTCMDRNRVYPCEVEQITISNCVLIPESRKRAEKPPTGLWSF